MNAGQPGSPISDLLKRTISESGVSYNALQRDTGVTRASIMRFVRGDQSLRLDMADRLAAYLGSNCGRRKRCEMARSQDSKVRHFHTKIVGVTHKNADGSNRQKIIRKCGVFETLVFDHEEDNPHDANAVRVCRQNGQQLGYLNSGRMKR